MRYYITLFLILLGLLTKAQENYSTLTQTALETMWKAKDESDYKKALNIYEEAFRIYPDSIDGLGLYKSSVLASELKDYDKAFKYLTPLAAMKVDEEGYPGWSYIIGKYSEKEYKNLLSESKCETLKIKAKKDKKQFYNELREQENEFFSTISTNLKNVEDNQTLYKQLKNFNPYKTKNNRNYSISFKVNDSIKTSFFIHLPSDYNPDKKYSLLFFLHGAVRSNSLTDYQLADWNLGGWNRYYTKYAEQNDVILVFPKGSRQYNWMMPDD